MKPNPIARELMTGSCWSEVSAPAILAGDSGQYTQLASEILDAVPCSWNRIGAFVTIDRDRRERFHVDTECGAPDALDPQSYAAIRRSLLRMFIGALIPDNVSWVGVWIDYDVNADTMVVSMVHGGMRPINGNPPFYNNP